MNIEVVVSKEAITKDTDEITEFSYFNEHSKPIHIATRIYKKKPLIEIYPYSYTTTNGLALKRINTITLNGWHNIQELPPKLKTGNTVKLTVKNYKILMNFINAQFKEVEKIKITKDGLTRFSKKTITFLWKDLDEIIQSISKEVKTYEIRRKTAITNSLSKITKQITPRKTALSKDSISHFFSYYDSVNMSDEDYKAITNLFSISKSHISVTKNFLESQDKINVAYLEEVIQGYEALLKAQNENEKAWQLFFDKHGWILANLFPFQVILYKKEAYVGGKTISNSEGRVVDFLFQNGFKDNYALLEIKTHHTLLFKSTAYREPAAYSMHESFSGAISQCLDQKSTFLTEFGSSYKSFDPKSVLIIGTKSKLSETQKNCFELVRSNNKHVEIVTFDELLEKIKGLKDIINKKN